MPTLASRSSHQAPKRFILLGASGRVWRLEVCFLRIGNVDGKDALLGNTAMRSEDGHVSLYIYPDRDAPRRSYVGTTSLATLLCALVLKPVPFETALSIGSTNSASMRDLLNAADINRRAWLALRAVLKNITLGRARLVGMSLATEKSGVPLQPFGQGHQAVGEV